MPEIRQRTTNQAIRPITIPTGFIACSKCGEQDI
jgi:hypothetical protein